MSYKLSYDEDNRLIISDVQCDCPCAHNVAEQDVYVGKGIVENIARYIRKRGLGTRCLLTADNNTWDIAGRHVYDMLKEEGFDVTLCIIRREGAMDPDERAVGEVFLSVQKDTEFMVSVGSGSITDCVRVVATRLRLPQVCVGTAPSMDGYTSAICPLTLRGLKIHREGKCPEIILCDIDILKTAPAEMICSGVGDVLGKYIARADWMIGSIINDEAYCPTCGEIVADALKKLLDHADEIRAKTDEGIRILTEALLLSGMTIMLIGHTRAVASVEHNIAHYWEMMQLIHRKTPPMHGSSVGVATLLVWPIFERFAKEDLSALSEEKIRAARLSRQDREKWMLYAFEEEAGQTIMQENPEDFLSWEEQKRRKDRAVSRFDEIRAVLESLPSLESIRGTMQLLGAQMTPQEMGIDGHLLNLSMYAAKDYRSRYTLFKLLDECGLLSDYLAQYPRDWE